MWPHPAVVDHGAEPTECLPHPLHGAEDGGGETIEQVGVGQPGERVGTVGR